MLMYLGANSCSLSITLYTFLMVLPFRGGRISKEKAGCLPLLIRSITFMRSIFICGKNKKRQVGTVYICAQI
ncbi:hypothetical protein Barb7_00329 [Bacteroidales bacterium Barb7]|nr:hypothetical protein Barb7_00329 [Bacteroidales bacterium Barb7]